MPALPAPVPTTIAAPSVAAASGILVTGDGRVLWSKNATTRRAIASTTKIMTALVAMEQSDPHEPVTASERAEAVGAEDPLVTELELVAGERLTVEQLLYGLLLPSGSDAAIALAEHTAGSVQGFVQAMNERARSLGALDTHFTNPHGLDDPGAYSTAYDLSLMTREALTHTLFRKIVATTRHTIPWPGHPVARELINRNELLGVLPGADGVKTGNTRNAGPSLVASATREGEVRISVILDSPDRFADSRQVLEFGFDAFRRHALTRAGVRWGQLTYGDGTTFELVPTEDLTLLVGVGSPAPSARYRPAGSTLVINGMDGITVPIEVRCGQPECAPPQSRRWLLSVVMSLLAPLMVALR